MTTPPNADDVDRNRPWASPDGPPPAPSPTPEAAAPATSGPPERGTTRGTDRTAIAALVTGLIGLVPLAIPFAVAALVRLRRGTRKGRGLAVGALAASLAWAAAGTLVAVLALGASLERDASGVITKGGEARFLELREGDCFTGYDVDNGTPEARPGTVRAVPCSEPHTGEVVARMPQTSPVGIEEAGAQCRGKSTYLRKSRVRQLLQPYIGLPPTPRGGDVVCAVHHAGGALTTPLAETVDTKLKTYQELTPGTCIGGSPDKLIVPVVPCDEAHWHEVFATYEISVGGSYAPGTLPPRPTDEGALLLGTQRRCIAEAEKIFDTLPPEPGLRVAARWPSPEDWEIGILTVVCYWSATGEAMKGSLMPE